jgi:GT2 family glycosyltransferase
MREKVQAEKATRCEVAIPVYNGLTHLRPCVESVLAHTRSPYRLILLDDGSDERTVEFMQDVARRHQHVRLLRNPENLGFVKTCNRAIAESSSEYVLLLNSDTIVTPGWLEKMVVCADSDPSIAAASPLSNFCPHMHIKMLPGLNLFQMAELVEALSDRTYPDITTCEGFCLLLSRRAVQELGAFDEIFGAGYGEESDFCMRAVSRGWRTVCTDDTYIYHKGRGTFGHQVREELYNRNKVVFHSRWGELYRRDFEDFQRRKPIEYLRQRIDQQCRQGWYHFDGPPPPNPRKTRWVSDLKQPFNWLPRPEIKFSRKPEPRVSVQMTQRLPRLLGQAKTILRALGAAPAMLRRRDAVRHAIESPGKLRVTFLLPTMRPYGGVISVINLANELVLAGIDAKIITMSRYKDLEHQLYTEPIFCRDRREIPELFPEVDIAVATQWETVDHIQQVQQLQPLAKKFYFIQDYEVNFLPREDTQRRQQVIDTYSKIKWKVVKTEHLRQQVCAHHTAVFKISPGMDLDSFYPQSIPDGDDARQRRVLCMARPATPWRGFDTMCSVFEKVHAELQDVEFILYGTADLSEYQSQMRFPVTNRGMLSHRELPNLYRSSAVYCDFSHAHGFGRTGVEAMACGCACVLTESGGVSEYAIDGWNALLCPPGDVEGLAAAVLRLLRGPELRSYLSRNGTQTVKKFSDRIAAGQMNSLFTLAMASGMGTANPRPERSSESCQ